MSSQLIHLSASKSLVCFPYEGHPSQPYSPTPYTRTTRTVSEQWETLITSWFNLFNWRCKNFGIENLSDFPTITQPASGKAKEHRFPNSWWRTRSTTPWHLVAMGTTSLQCISSPHPCYAVLPLQSAGKSFSSQPSWAPYSECLCSLKSKKSPLCCGSTKP